MLHCEIFLRGSLCHRDNELENLNLFSLVYRYATLRIHNKKSCCVSCINMNKNENENEVTFILFVLYFLYF